MKLLALLPIAFMSCGASAAVIPDGHVTAEMAIAADRGGDTQEAIRQFEVLARRGDERAMITLGVKYHQGKGVQVDYSKAMDWYLKAYDKRNGDALNNIGVMYRDGQGVSTNSQIAYLLFLAVHMAGLGDEDTQYRAGSCLSRLAIALPQQEINQALCFTWNYVDQVVHSRGTNTVVRNDVLPSPDRPRIKDNNWWLDSEKARMTFDCQPPWDQEAQPPAGAYGAPADGRAEAQP